MTRVVFIISLPLANGLVFNLAVQANGDTFPKRVTALRSFTVRHGDRLDLNYCFTTFHLGAPRSLFLGLSRIPYFDSNFKKMYPNYTLQEHGRNKLKLLIRVDFLETRIEVRNSRKS